MIEGNSKTIAILSYCSPIGYLIAWIMYSQDRSIYAAYHMKQATGLVAATISLPIITKVIDRFGDLFVLTAIPAVVLALIALNVIGIINASTNKFSELPVVGKYFTKWFAFID